MKFSHRWSRMFGVLGLAALVVAGKAQAGVEVGNEHPWNVSFTAGRLDMEGDQPTRDGFVTSVRVGYDYTEWWTFEGTLTAAPVLKGTKYVKYFPDEDTFREVDRLYEETGSTETWAIGPAVDALFHFTRWKRVDPYLSAGVGVLCYGEEIGPNDGIDPQLRLGGGLMYHFNDEWAVRVDFRSFAVGTVDKSNANSELQAGVCWTWGAHVPPAYKVTGGPQDSDADGLTDAEELQLGTDPYDPDTDKDQLSDFAEVRTHKTDPLNPDTDYDALKDGAEVLVYKTDPLKRDTDNGGVADGHEVIEDGTNPLDPSDDLMLFELYINFDYDKAIIKPEYFSKLDVIGKVLERDPGATARIEGHADKLKKSAKKYNDELSERRAVAVMKYIEDKHGIQGARMKAVGYGFSRPKEPNDPVNGNPKNRRVEVYIRPSNHPGNTGEMKLDKVQVKGEDVQPK